MEFRTKIEPLKNVREINHDHRIVMLGSCFTDNIGKLLKESGFNVSVNEMGTLYNPMSIANAVRRALEERYYTKDDLHQMGETYHCLDFESRRQAKDYGKLLDTLNQNLRQFRDHLLSADIWIVTFGTAWVFRLADSGTIVGNCHKFPADHFRRERLTVEEIRQCWSDLLKGRRVIFTVSPIRHLADGLHGNALSKSTLLLATEEMGEYFPAYEIVNDDLRDYRFYSEDMKHPSESAVKYIYEIFEETYFSCKTKSVAKDHRKRAAQLNHRPIIHE